MGLPLQRLEVNELLISRRRFCESYCTRPIPLSLFHPLKTLSQPPPISICFCRKLSQRYTNTTPLRDRHHLNSHAPRSKDGHHCDRPNHHFRQLRSAWYACRVGTAHRCLPPRGIVNSRSPYMQDTGRNNFRPLRCSLCGKSDLLDLWSAAVGKT